MVGSWNEEEYRPDKLLPVLKKHIRVIKDNLDEKTFNESASYKTRSKGNEQMEATQRNYHQEDVYMRILDISVNK